MDVLPLVELKPKNSLSLENQILGELSFPILVLNKNIF